MYMDQIPIVQSFFQDMFNKINMYDNASMILCGDWNVVMDYNLETCVKNNNSRARSRLKNIMENLSLVDIWRVENISKFKHTWKSSYRPVKLGRLDYFLITEDMQNITCKTDIIPGYRS